MVSTTHPSLESLMHSPTKVEQNMYATAVVTLQVVREGEVDRDYGRQLIYTNGL